MSLNALISPTQLVYNYTVEPPEYLGWRVAQVEPDGQTFEVGSPLFWTACSDYVVADVYYYKNDTSEFLLVPTPPEPQVDYLLPPEQTLNATKTVS